jgi:hypothetical protein
MQEPAREGAPSSVGDPGGAVPGASAQESAATMVAPRVGPPDTTYHMKLGYGVAIAIFSVYIALLIKRVAGVRRSR